MKKIRLICAFTALALCISLFSCAKKSDEEPGGGDAVKESESMPEPSSELETAPSEDLGTGETPEVGVSTGGAYTDDGMYTPAATVEGKDVLFSGSYDEKKGVTVTPAVSDKKPGGSVTDPTQPSGQPSVDPPNVDPSNAGQPSVNPPNVDPSDAGQPSVDPSDAEQPKIDPPTEDIYKKALDSLGSYTADISFCYYVDMDDGWHESHPSRIYVSYDDRSDSYVGKTRIGNNEYAVYYANGIYTTPDAKEIEAPIDIFLRQCNYVTPLELSSYNFEMTEDVTAVSTFLGAAGYRYKLLMASNFFSGYENETNTNITMEDLFYSARISSEGRLLSTKYEYTFTNAGKSGDMHITVVIDTVYE